MGDVNWDLDLNLDLKPVDSDLRPMYLDLTISNSEDLEKGDMDLPLWDLTTSLLKTTASCFAALR